MQYMASPGSPSGEKDLPLDLRKAIQELMVGKEFAAQVERRLREDTEIAALMDVVIGSISRALSSLYPYSMSMRFLVGKGRPACPETSEDVTERGNISWFRIPPFPLRQQVTDTMDDGFIWRKYGQKIIQSSIHPRSYYRCLHKYDQGCQATRQVQKSPENPSRFLITYHGHHTCKPLALQHVIAYSSSLKEESLISFGSRAYNTPQDAPLLSSSVPTAEVLASLTPAGSSCSDTTMKSNLGTYEGSVHGSRIMGSISDYEDVNLGGNEESVHGARNFVPVSDHGDVTPGLQSSLSSLDMNCLVDSFDYMDEMFNFDEGDFTYFKDGEGFPFF